MSCHVTKVKKSEPCWNDMEELKYLICAIDNNKCPSVPQSPSRNVILPPRIEEIPCEIPSRRPPCVPPPRCCPITLGPCCPPPLPPSIPMAQPLPINPSCCNYSPLPCYLKN